MCGLVGVAAGDLNNKERDVFKDMLILDQVRGTHGTGVAAIEFNGNYDIAKRSGHAFDLMDHRSFDKVCTLTKKVYIGHNRYATTGRHSHDNAHPFGFRNVVGAHNGTLENVTKNRMHMGHTFDVDSEALIGDIDHNIAEGMRWDDALAHTIERASGAWALTLFFPEAKKLVFLRNDERPLFYTYSKDRKHLFWASELWMLNVTLARRGIETDSDTPFVLNPDTMLAWDIPVMGRKFEPPMRREIKGQPKSVGQYYNHANACGWTPQTQSGGKTETSPLALARINDLRGKTTTTGTVSDSKTTATATDGDGDLKNVTYLNRSVKDRFPNDPKDSSKKKPYGNPYKYPDGTVMTKPEFEDIIKRGHSCAYCNIRTPTWGEQVLFLQPDARGAPQYLCEVCIEDPEVFDIMKHAR